MDFMKTSLKFEPVTVLLLPIITCILAYITVVTLEESSRDTVLEEIVNSP